MTVVARESSDFDAGSIARRLVAATRWRRSEALFWFSAFGLYFVFGGYIGAMPVRLALMSEIVSLALLALSVDLVLGYAGIVTLGQGAFFGVGAYAAALIAKWGAGTFPLSDPLIGLCVGGAAAALAGFASSFLVLRGSDLTRLMVTLGVALILAELANQMRWLTGGADGLDGVVSTPVLGMFDFDLYGRVAYLYSLTVLFLLFWLARHIVNSPFGLALRAIRGNCLRSRAVGVPVERRLVAVYTVAAAYAGVAGALLAQASQSASPDMIAFHRSADALLILVFGGAGSLYGGLVGAALFRIMQDQIGAITQQYWQFWVGLALVLLVLFVRGGVLGLTVVLRARLGLGPGRKR